MRFVGRVVLFTGPWIALVLAGCEPDPPSPPSPVAGRVPLKVWIVLSPQMTTEWPHLCRAGQPSVRVTI